MPADQIVLIPIFVILTIMTLGGGLGVVSSRSVFHSALFLVLSLVGVVGYYVLLDAGFLAVMQLLIYVGAIAVLILFAIMLSRGLMARRHQSRPKWPLMTITPNVQKPISTPMLWTNKTPSVSG